MVVDEDFNLTRFAEDRQGCVSNPNNMEAFNDVIRHLKPIDVPLGGVLSFGLIREPHLLLLNLIVFLSPKLGMTCFHYPLARHFPTTSMIMFPSPFTPPHFISMLKGSILRLRSWNTMILGHGG